MYRGGREDRWLTVVPASVVRIINVVVVDVRGGATDRRPMLSAWLGGAGVRPKGVRTQSLAPVALDGEAAARSDRPSITGSNRLTPARADRPSAAWSN